MRSYKLPDDQRIFIEGMRQPFAVARFFEGGVSALAVSDGFCELFGYEDRMQAYSDMDQNMFKDVHPEDTAMITNAILRFGTEGGSIDVLYRTRRKDGSGYRTVRMIGDHVISDDGQRLAHVWFTDEDCHNGESDPEQTDETGAEAGENRHEYSVRYDYLTGLPEMASFFERAEIRRKIMLDEGREPALLYIDLCGMKRYNHKYGFSAGDNMLRLFARLLSQTFLSGNCCHIGADRFAVITNENDLEEKLEDMFSEWRRMNEESHLPIRVGIYENRMEEVAAGMVLDRAKIACDMIRGSYSSCFNYYSEKLNELIEKRQYILDNFERALSERWIEVYYQPIKRAVNGKVCDEEALARWNDPEKGLLPPVDFIPYLEDAGLIYKLDLYVLDRVLEHIKIKKDEGFYIVPHSLNLSRSDFDACDMPEEIRLRVDAAGVSRDRISIEITESVIGSDFGFMKEQVERFQALGFPVWMDDFGSGYSSLDVLQSIRFDLLKFDMGFMQKLDESESGRIILTELMKMALALGIDTICEGVETEEQVRFLQEIGCSKLQGFFLSRPAPIDYVLEYHREHKLDGYEDPEESAYYELLCGVNLYDVGVIAREEKTSLRNTYNTLPMCIIEINGDSTRFVRTNQSYRDFAMRFFNIDLAKTGSEFAKYDAAFMYNVVKTCVDQGIRTFYDERMPDGSIIHSFARRIGVNPVNGNTAVAIAVLSIREADEKLMIEQILSIIEELGETMPGGFFIYRADGNEELIYANKAVCSIFGCDSLEEFREFTGFTFRGMVHPDDYEKVSASIKDQVKESQADIDFVEYRIIRRDGAVRWLDDYGHYIEYDEENRLYYVFVSDITEKYEQAESDKALRTAVIEALTKVYDSVWLISDIETQSFELLRVDEETEHMMPAMTAAKISRFSQALDFYSKLVYEEDRLRFLESVTPESIDSNTEKQRIYSVPFRRMFSDGVRHYRLDFTRLELPGGKTSIVAAFKNVDGNVRGYANIPRIANSDYQPDHAIYIHIAQALARGYTDLYYVNIETDELIEFHTDDEFGVLAEVRRSADFFEGCRRDVKLFVHPDDQEKFVQAMDREFLKNVLDESGVFEMTYRRIKEGRTFYVRMRVTRAENDSNYVVLAVSDIDELMKKRLDEERMLEERIIYARLHALTGNFIVVYVVDPETDRYHEFSATADYTEFLSQARSGDDFFEKVRSEARQFNYPADLERFLSAFTKERIMAEIGRSGIFTLGYRIMMKGEPVHVQMKAAMVEEKEGPRLVVGLNDIDAQIRQEEELEKRLVEAESQANIDALTSVKNRHAYLEAEALMDRRIAEHRSTPFAIVMLDVNDLKKINDTYGHQAGDQYLRDACRIICDTFKHSPVFRVGGDEFAVIVQGSDHSHLDELIADMRERNEKAIRSGDIVVACGMAEFEGDTCVASVLERADHSMYDEKSRLKSL